MWKLFSRCYQSFIIILQLLIHFYCCYRVYKTRTKSKNRCSLSILCKIVASLSCPNRTLRPGIHIGGSGWRSAGTTAFQTTHVKTQLQNTTTTDRVLGHQEGNWVPWTEHTVSANVWNSVEADKLERNPERPEPVVAIENRTEEILVQKTAVKRKSRRYLGRQAVLRKEVETLLDVTIDNRRYNRANLSKFDEESIGDRLIYFSRYW